MVVSAFSPEVIPLWPDGAPGSENWSQQEQESYLCSGWSWLRDEKAGTAK